MDIIAAFRWDSSEKSISFMAIDENYSVRIIPLNTKLPKNNLNQLFQEAENTIKGFFKEIETIYRGKPDANIRIEYKIVGHGSPAHHYHTKMHKPSDSTEFVRKSFFETFNDYKSAYSLRLAEKQYRTNLKKPALTQFKAGLDNLELIEKKKNNAYQYHLWALILHATKSNYAKEITKLTKILKPEKVQQIDKKKRYPA
ncbi:TPA: hypothetical protein I8Z84_000064 [Legionella pneumophila]|nr:hypothetical protein [Legionella pneumophila]